MQEQSRYAIGIDIGTTTVRCVVGHIDSTSGAITVVGVGESPTSGMRKGVVVNLSGPAQAIDTALGEAERMSGQEINQASLSINGAHILSTKADGMIAVSGGEITEDDLYRVEEVATSGKIPANRDVLEIVPYSFKLDGQEGIKNPAGMIGTRLEIYANIISALEPHVVNIRRAAEKFTVHPNNIIVASMASARAVLNEKQLESGVAVIDMGGSTTGVSIYEEGDLQYTGTVPLGGINITNDLAIGLKTDPEIAELVKLKHGRATVREDHETVSVKHEKELHTFSTEDIDEIIEARLEEIFEGVQKELKKAGCAGKLPSGIVLTGDASHIKEIIPFVRKQLGLAVRIGKPAGFGGVEDKVAQAEYAAAVGLMLIDSDMPNEQAPRSKDTKKQKKKSFLSATSRSLSSLFGKYKG